MFLGCIRPAANCDHCYAGWETLCKKQVIQVPVTLEFLRNTVWHCDYGDPEGVDLFEIAPILAAGVTVQCIEDDLYVNWRLGLASLAVGPCGDSGAVPWGLAQLMWMIQRLNWQKTSAPMSELMH